jgi:hypothetical protein
MIVKPPLWYRALHAGLFIACLMVGVVAVFAFHSTPAVTFGLMAFLLAATMLTIAVMSVTRSLELRGDRLYSVLITGTQQVEVREIGSMRMSRLGNGMSRCGFVRHDGTAVFGKTRRAWPTSDLLKLADAMNVSVQWT